MNGIVAKPVLFNKLDAELALKISQWIAKDNARALEKRRKRREAKAKKKPSHDG